MQNGASKVLGTISAMQSFTEHFPSSLLDMMGGTTYTNIFYFLTDVLKACGVDIKEIMKTVIDKVFGIDIKSELNVEAVYDAIDRMNIDNQSVFIQGIEYSVKGILMALLSSIFSCAAIPILPDRYFDISGSDDDERFPKAAISSGIKMKFPISSIDMFNTMNISPTSNLGRFYYATEGRDVYYQKVKTFEKEVIPSGEPVDTVTIDDIATVSIVFGTTQRQDPSQLKFKLSKPFAKDIHIKIVYDDDTSKELSIKANTTESQPINVHPDEKDIYDVRFKCDESDYQLFGCVVAHKTWVYFSENKSRAVVRAWRKDGYEADWGWGLPDDIPEQYHDEETYEHDITIEKEVLKYVELKNKVDNAVRVNVVPELVNDDSPEFIVCYVGLTSDELYKAYDLNSVLWYAYNFGQNSPQIEYNKLMWDSRISARNLKTPIVREEPSDWNQWYNSKKSPGGKFTSDVTKDPNGKIHPIIQLHNMGDRSIEVLFPAQQYYKPNAKNTDSGFTYTFIRQNATLYQFNWEYLNSIQIFNPKTLLMRMFDSLMNGLLTTAMQLKPTFNQQMLRAKLSNAIVKYIEAVDTQTEDCYFSFSNDELNAMLEDMLLSRYAATRYNGENHVVQEHDIQEYFDRIDEIDTSATQDGTTYQITKLISDVSLSAGSEDTIDYGISMNMDNKWYEQLLFAIVEPLVESLFSPQVMLLIMINFDIMGITNTEDMFNQSLDKLVRLIINKIFALIKSIIAFIKDKIAEILLELFYNKILPILLKQKTLLLLEKIDAWMRILRLAFECIPMYKPQKLLGQIDEVNYADIVEPQSIPETMSPC